MNNDQLIQFLSGVQANLEKTLISVNLQLSAVKTSQTELGLEATWSPPPPPVLKFTPSSDVQPIVGEDDLLPGAVFEPRAELAPLDANGPAEMQRCSSPEIMQMPALAPPDVNGQHQAGLAPASANALPSVSPFVKGGAHIPDVSQVDLSVHGFHVGKTNKFTTTNSSMPVTLFQYTWEDHTVQELALKLEDVRSASDIPPSHWKRRLRMTGQSGCQIEVEHVEHLAQSDFPVTVQWAWLQWKDLEKPSLLSRVKFLYVGLTNNTHLRALLLRLKSRLQLIEAQATVLFEQMLDDINNEADAQHIGNEGVDHRVDCVEIATNSNITETMDTLRKLEALLKHEFTHKRGAHFKTDELFQMAGCPFDDFVEIYIRDRDAAFTSVDHQRREVLKVVLRGTNMVTVLCGYLQRRIDENDQMLFRMLLMGMNLVTMLAQFLYVDYIKAKPLWVRQVQQIFDIVSK